MREHGVNQLDLFRQPAEPTKSEGDAHAGSDAGDAAPLHGPASTASPSEKPRRTQMTELSGETWEHAFGGETT